MPRTLTRLLSTLLASSLVSAAARAEEAREFRPRRVVPAFPAIENAKTVEAKAVTDEVRADELVLGVVVDGEARAYPINQLTRPTREIINDEIRGHAIAATW